MAWPLNKSLIRQIDSYFERGRPLVIKLTDEGIYLKRKGERWTTSVLCTWATAYKMGCIREFNLKKKEKEEKRKLRRLG